MSIQPRALIEKVEADDPVKEEAEQDVLEAFVEELKAKPELMAALTKGKKVPVSVRCRYVEELDQDDLNQLLMAAIDRILAEKKAKTRPKSDS